LRFATGLLVGLAATGLNFAVMYVGVRWLFNQPTGASRFVVPLANAVRYLVLGAIIFAFLRLRLGSVLGLLAGVTVGIAGFLTWQMVNNARYRRSS
jgi:hypothetical protein